MSNLIRFVGIIVVLILAALLMLAVGGVLSSTQLWHNATKVVELAAIVLVASAIVLLFTKK